MGLLGSVIKEKTSFFLCLLASTTFGSTTLPFPPPFYSLMCLHPSYSLAPFFFRHAGAKRNLEGEVVYGHAAGLQPLAGRAQMGAAEVSTLMDLSLVNTMQWKEVI